MYSTPLCTLLLAFSITCVFCYSSALDGSDGWLTDGEVSYFRRRKLLNYRENSGDRGENVSVDRTLVFENPRLRNTYIALQAWEQAMISDPQNLTVDGIGYGVCNYTGVFCAPTPDNSSEITIAGIDLNHGNIAGYLPEELGLLKDLALFHINSNRFCGTVSKKFRKLKLLFELDLSNNRFAGRNELKRRRKRLLKGNYEKTKIPLIIRQKIKSKLSFWMELGGNDRD